MTYPLFKWTPKIGRSFMMPLLACLIIGFFNQELTAQVTIPHAQRTGVDTCQTVKLETCDGTVTEDDLRWTDDGFNDGNYADPMGDARMDSIEFCPKDKWHRVRVVFTDFDLYDADGDGEVDPEDDFLNVYQGSKAEVRTMTQTIGFILADPLPPAGSARIDSFIWDSALVPTAGNPHATNGGQDATLPATSTPGVGFRRTGPTPTAIPIAGTGTGVGVAKAFGGWVDASCSPSANPSGCLTFILRTNGDNKKGAGWDAWVDCQARDIELDVPNVGDFRLKCDESFASVTLPFATVKACGETFDPHDGEHIIRLLNQYGEKLFEVHTKNTDIGPLWVGAGQYMAEYLLKSDTTKVERVPFSVQAPSLVGNDDVTIPLGAACMAAIEPDFVLENPCDTIFKVLYYDVTVTIPGAHGFKDVVIGSENVLDTLRGVIYPTVTAADIKAAGQSVCDVTATVKVDRILYPFDAPLPIEYYNGVVTSSVNTNVKFIDKQQPWIDIQTAPDTLIACDTTGLDRLLKAGGVDNCDEDVPVTYSIRYTETDPCFSDLGSPDTTLIYVDYTATDDCGNIGKATKEVTLIRPDLSDQRYVVKTQSLKIDCNASADAAKPGVKIGVWKNGMLDPTNMDTVTLSTEEYICGYILVAEEEDIPSTDCGSKKYVYYSVIDWCNSSDGVFAIDTTLVETTDTIAPEFDEGEGEAVSVELEHFSCTYDLTKLPKPKATDNCDPTPNVRIGRVARIEDGKTLWIVPSTDYTKVDCDSFEIRWIVEDDCHEQLVNDTLDQIVVIKDVTKPSAVCVDQLNVSVPNEWGARVYVDDIDAGSYDACGIASRLIRIKDSGDDFAEYVTIGCEYIHPDLQLELQILDKKGNENICWLDVAVEDKINPYCEPLENVVGDCEAYHDGVLGASTDTDGDLEMDEDEYVDLTGELLALYNTEFGDPATLKICSDNLDGADCGVLDYEQEYQLLAWPCGEYKIQRRYRAKDWSGNVSNWNTQLITITAKQNWKITFPSDWEGTCGDMAPAEDILVENGACDLLAYEVTERQFEVPGDACFKLERTYHIINWCKYVAGTDPVEIARIEGDHGFAEGLMVTSEGNENVGYWTYIQVLKVHDDLAPTVTVVNPDPCINGVEFDVEPYGEEDITPGFGPYECDEPKTWSAIAIDCSANISWVGRLYNAETNELVQEVETNEITQVVYHGQTFYAEFWAYDNCGNSGGERGEDIEFKDCKKPTPYLLNGIAVELMPTGMIQVWASDLDQNSFDNCSDQSKLDLRIWSEFLGDAPTDLLGVLNLGKVITFPCERVGTNEVSVYVIDEAGNWDFATTYIIVQDNGNACFGFEPKMDGMVAGQILDPNGEKVESVNMTITGGDEKAMTTGTDGKFMFMMPTGEDYTLTPTKDINPLNGVSTFDLVLISKHILGITPFDSPYKYIAADVNKSGSITAFDMVQLRQLILNINTEFANNDSWRFVDAAYEFTSNNPAAETFGEFYNIENHSTDLENMDFVGVKVGDVNGNAKANSLLAADTRNTNGALTLTTTDRMVEVGENVTVTLNGTNIEQVQGYQFTLNFAGTNTKVAEGIAKANNFNTKLGGRGLIATSWNGEATANDELFTLSFTATATGLLSELITVSEDITTAEAYNTAGDLMDVKLVFNNSATAADFELGQNSPNPFNGETAINFTLPVAGNATLKIMDAQGKVLKVIAADYTKGANTITLKANELSATGVLYYQLESAKNIATKKMIIIE